MEEWCKAASFPPHFGGTWDALRDVLSDLPEGGTFLVLDADQLLQDAPSEEAHLLWMVLKAVQEDLRPKPFQLLLQAEGSAYSTLVDGLRALGLDQPDVAR
ncbi:barstar family protein [Geothrix sp. PMB-07]|uniref:barstar family protein n=1 Tax=Geothrix sp. PMB-07 TaxID=3068640 RepID=UPI0027426727|nr:barstar family protein [Geothrix sp. PMB-07]WLT31735.1 barstar family protein [Geothrix sp. PMB-07]